MQTIGILGGLGPQATADFNQRLVSLCQTKYGAVQDYEYPPIILYEVPIREFDEKGIEKELAEFLKDSDLYAKIPRESAEKGIRNFLGSKEGRVTLGELIDYYVHSRIQGYIETADAASLLVGYDIKTKEPRYKLFIFPSAFEAKDGKKPTTRSMNDLLLRQFEFVQNSLVIPKK